MPFPIGVKKVIRSWRILVYALLDQAHAKDTGIKVDVVLSVARNAGYVVESGYACHGEYGCEIIVGLLRSLTYGAFCQAIASSSCHSRIESDGAQGLIAED